MTGQMAQAGRPEPFRLLFVCTGNICRSPFAQLHARALLDVRLGPAWAPWFAVASAGTGAVVGSGMHPQTRATFGPRAGHADVEAFRARQLPARDIRLADLVLTASRRHRSAVLELEPRALRSTFTVREFVRLVGAVDLRALPPDPLARARALVPAALDQRGVLPPVPAEEDAIPDPVAGGDQDHAAATRMIDAAVRALVDAIAGGMPPRRPGPPAPRRRGPMGPGGPVGAGPGRPVPSGPIPTGPPRPPTVWTPPAGWASPAPAPDVVGGPRDGADEARSAHEDRGADPGPTTSGSVQVGPIRVGAGQPSSAAPVPASAAPVPASADPVASSAIAEPDPVPAGPAVTPSPDPEPSGR